jgi:lipoprotein-anchoring transpeptidase ErfK/SrfK
MLPIPAQSVSGRLKDLIRHARTERAHGTEVHLDPPGKTLNDGACAGTAAVALVRETQRMRSLAGAIFLIALAASPLQAEMGRGLVRGNMEALADQPGHVPATVDEELDVGLQRQPVYFRTTEQPGTIVVNTSERFLYLVQGNNRAIRYGVGVGRDGFQWSGIHRISRKGEWPDWTPPPEMIERQPYLPRFMAGGPGNPMGARALYIGSTVYRLHGTNQPHTIGQAVSSGCFRLVNPDIIDLYERVEVGTKVVVLHARSL